MARVTKQKAGKDYPDQGIKKGNVYYKWTVGFRGREQRSPTPPRRSQTIGSETLSEAVAVHETFEHAVQAAASPEDFASACEEAATSAEERMDAFQESIDNMSETFTGGSPAIDEKQEQYDNMESWKSELESFDAESHKPDKAGETEFADLSEELQTEWLNACREECEGYGFDL